jgi:hypothetical protein
MWSSAVALPCRKACNAPSSPSLLRIGFSSRLTKLSGLSRFPRLLRNSAASACLPLTIGKSVRANWGEREKARGRRDLFGVMCLPNRLFQTTMIRFGTEAGSGGAEGPILFYFSTAPWRYPRCSGLPVTVQRRSRDRATTTQPDGTICRHATEVDEVRA